jgi:hypothetical protein
MASRSRRMFCARCSFISRPLQSEGAGNAGRPMRPIAACAMSVVERTRVSQVTPESPGIPAQWFTASCVLSPVHGLFGHRRPRKLPSANLTPASGCQDHTTSPSASAPFVIGTSASTASRPASVTIANRPSVGRDGAHMQLICVRRQAVFRKFRMSPARISSHLGGCESISTSSWEERAFARVSKDGRESLRCPSFETRAKRPAPRDEVFV